MKGYLVLEDGTVMEGRPFGFSEDVTGEVVFSTGMTGYQESLTDPSYCGQILVSSYPMIGNYGINSVNSQSKRVQVRGYVIGELCDVPSHRLSGMTLNEFLKQDEVPGISRIDTRALIRKLRLKGTMRGAITTADPKAVLEQVRGMRNPDEENLVARVSTPEAVVYESGKGRRVVVIDCGVKESILTELRARFDVVQVPFDASADSIRAMDPDGVFITNGPGNPAHKEMLETTVGTLRELKEETPMMGICLGNQLLALALGAKTYKLKFGHRGINQPVGKDGRVYITSQNHGFAVDRTSAEDVGMEITFVNLNDGTVEGMRHSDLPIFSVQFHPEARPGPLDTRSLFDEFAKMLEGA
ncbi:MAG: glutamine-hydrolyzing carbamoyl-phosphate synthase small subunit [Candidatus Thermoplasmatota archaeon]|nr:glutamine-hydrolyzing carbamoyl-phosphate synthase small subunit [Candidatus Thermoplasmatota archaeon]